MPRIDRTFGVLLTGFGVMVTVARGVGMAETVRAQMKRDAGYRVPGAGCRVPGAGDGDGDGDGSSIRR